MVKLLIGRDDVRWKQVIGIYAGTLVLIGAYVVFVQPLRDFLGTEIYLDLRPDGYDRPEVLAFFDRLGLLGRAFYVRSTIFDTVWPLAVAMSAWILARKTFQRLWLAAIVAALPVGFGILDLFENIGILGMLQLYPEIPEGLVTYSNTLTLAKLSLLNGATIVFFALPVVSALLWVFRNRHKN